jgi:ribonuclease HI
MIRVFTDGACKSNGKRGAQGSYAYYFPEHTEWSGAFRIPEDEPQTNNRGELLAIYKGIQKSLEMSSASDTELQIYTDSTYSRDCLTKWLPGWLRNSWKNSEGEDVKHRDLIEGSSMILPKFKSFSISYVKAHTGKTDELSKNNDIVDRMAVNILVPKEPTVEISTTDDIFPNLPLRMMGSPIDYSVITDWCLKNLDKLDQQDLKTALYTAFHKTVSKKGYELEIQKINKSKVVRLVSKTNIIKEGTTVIKHE